MFSLNRVCIIGYQTQPVDVRQTPSGASVTDLNLVVPYTFNSEKGETLRGKGFHTITMWGPMAEVARQYVRAGSQIFISGRLQTDSWDDQTSGEKKSKTKIVALDMILLDPKDGQHSAPDNVPHITGLLNRADVIGNVTRDPEMRTTASGQNVLTLGVATNERWKDKASGETKERVEFHSVVLWGALAEEAAKCIRKGSRVFASGRVQTRSWETQAGAKRTTTEIIADAVHLLGIKSAEAEDSIQVTSSRGNRSSAPSDRSESPSSEDLVAAVPEISYTSEIKPEDLPF